MFILDKRFCEEATESGDQGAGASGDVDYKARYEELESKYAEEKAERERLSHKITEANKHAKNAEKEAQRQAREKAEKENDFKQLFESSEAERLRLQQELEQRDSTSARKEARNAALTLAAKHAEGDNVELLADYIERRLKFSDGSVKVTDEKGNLTVSSLEDLGKEFASSKRYASLIKGSKASGGSAPGGENNGGAGQVITREQFNGYSPQQRMKFIKGGGKVKD